MVRKAIVILALLPASAAAQNSTTNCQKDYFGNLACQTQQQPGIDWSRANQGQVLQSGANSVPNYAEQQLRRREIELRERELELREQAIRQPVPPPAPASGPDMSDEGRQAFITGMLKACPKDGAPIPVGVMPAERRSVMNSLCYAFEQGRVAGRAER